MEVMEEGDLMDRVPVLLERDRQYYEQYQTVLQEFICPGVVGGTLDFPRSASFASVKMVEWWEDEYYAAYKKNSGLLHLNETNQLEKVIVKASSPEKFVNAITKSADKLLEHIHVLSQEALDHADLTVLTATIGASALIKNSLWVYLRSVTTNMCPPKGDENGGSLKMTYKQYSEISEALAERLLDLHVRLLSLYIIQDADCLHWENNQAFFESERGSYTIQMWWLYIQGTKQDLWNSVPPNMAKRVLAGILNETLSILAVRYAQVVPSQARSQLLLVDISNLLLCVADILPSVCETGEEYAGLNVSKLSKSIRDIHCKCQELFIILLMRGISLGSLYKSLRKGPSFINIFQQRDGSSSPWIQFALPTIFASDEKNQWANKSSEFGQKAAIAFELKILLNSPQANWSLLLKILLMRNAHLSSIVCNHLVQHLPTSDRFKPALSQTFTQQETKAVKCDRFLCGRECNSVAEWICGDDDPIGQTNYQVVLALVYVVTLAGRTADIRSTLVTALDQSAAKEWSSCLDRRQVWNQKRPPWFEAIHHLIYPVLDPVVHVMISSMQTGSTIYQTMAVMLSCLSEMLECIPSNVFYMMTALSEVITTEIRPLGESVLLQTLCSALYTKLLAIVDNENVNVASISSDQNIDSIPSLGKSSICSTLGEAICALDEDNKHTEGIHALVARASKLMPTPSATQTLNDTEYDVDSADFVADVILSDVLTTAVGKQSLKLLYNYLKYNGEWLLHQMNVSDIEISEFKSCPGQNIKEENSHLLRSMFHIGHRPFDQLLSGNLRINYIEWLQTPMSLTIERAYAQISKRYEFHENSKLSIQDTVMVAFIVSQFKN